MGRGVGECYGGQEESQKDTKRMDVNPKAGWAQPLLPVQEKNKEGIIYKRRKGKLSFFTSRRRGNEMGKKTYTGPGNQYMEEKVGKAAMRGKA